ncbi:MAG: chlorophyll synthase ChlG [Pseudomonadota bacterium]
MNTHPNSDNFGTGSHLRSAPEPSAVLALLKPITWFPPMWAYMCGAVSVGGAVPDRWIYIAVGVLLAGPLVCGTSQAVNDWFDRHVDAINEPNRVIPSGRVPGRWGLWIGIATSLLSLVVASFLGIWVFCAAVVGLLLAWAYSMPPLRLKQNGWIGNAAVGFSYETLPWFTAAAAALGAFPGSMVVWIAVLYGIGAHGIMTLNDFKAIDGDRQMGIRSLPVQLGVKGAALTAGAVMLAAQLGVIVLLLLMGSTWAMLVVSLLTAAQAAALVYFVADPIRRAVWYSAIGVGLYVSGMMVTAFALRAHEIARLSGDLP